MTPLITPEKREAIVRRAAEAMCAMTEPVLFELDPVLAVGLVGQLQIAFRHPANTGETRERLEQFVRDLIERLDPAHGDLHALLMMGFDARYDAPEGADFQSEQVSER
ncbi:MAG TPA: hypothetical protein VGX48_18745 [Pyrinomonadaceae bacterium]|jgi:hypothetical protein|nr:hypothetical protein [Pyrinomonadaceae bacterium]